MNTLTVIAFDLSSTCIGVTEAHVTDGIVQSVTAGDIMPKKFDATDYGYKTKGPKKIGEGYQALLKDGEHHITKAEAKRRIALFKTDKHRDTLLGIGEQLDARLKSKPDMLLIERNMSFNGVLTTKLLGEIAGQLYYYAGSNRIPFSDRSVHNVRAAIRKHISLSRDERIQPDGTLALETKQEIRARLRKVYGHLIDFNTLSLDASDALAVFHSLVIEKGWEVA